MLDYIKSQINSKRSVDKAPTPEEMPDEAVLEYAHIFQELSDVTSEGSDAGKVRKLGMDFDLLEEEITPTTVEFDIESGTLADVKNDATAVVESYTGMKTYDKFYQEAADQIVRFPRETDSSYDARVSELADQMYSEYCNDAAEFGYFGFGTISLTDERVPSKMNVDFGKFTQESDTSFIGKVGIFFSTDENHKITKKQLDSIALVKDGAFKNIGAPLRAYMESTYTIPEKVSVWDVCTPRNLIVPKGNGDSFCVILEYMNELSGEVEYYGWTEPVNPESDTVTQESCTEINKEAFVTESQYENKEKYLQALANAPKPVRFTKRPISRFVQESIDFGTGDPGSDVNAGGGDAGTAPAPAADTTTATGDQPAGDDTANADGNVATGNSSDAPEGNDTDTANKTDANVNNVSSEIADKVDEIQNNENNENMNPDTGALEGETITFDDGTSTVGDAGDNNGDASLNEETPGVEEPIEGSDTGDMGASVDDQLDDLNATPDEAAGEGEEPIPGVDDEGNIDLDNMTIDQLIEQGSEKLRQMPLGEIKNFLQSDSPEAVTESFVITTNNVNNEVTVRIRECLGILNDNSIDTKKIFSKFSHAGSRLNRVLVKAAKMHKIYNTDEIASIRKLNSSLTNLMVAAKKAKKDATSNVKNAITEFTKNCKIVSSFTEKKINGKPVQESFVQEGLFLSEGNAKKRLGKKIPLVYADMAAVVKAQEGGYLTKGKLSKMYKPKTGLKGSSWGASDDVYKTGSAKEFEINTPHSNYIADLTKIANKILRKEKVQRAFTRDELSTISDLVDNLDDYVDIVEAIIYDNSSDNSTIIEKLVDLAKKIMSNLDSIQGSTGETTNDSTTPAVEPTADDADTGDLGDSADDSDAELDLGDDDDESNTTDDTPDEDGNDATADTGSDDDSDVDIEGENDTEGEDE